MEKEITINWKQTTLSFFYEEMELTEFQKEQYSQQLLSLVKIFDEFKKTELSLDDFSINMNVNLCNDETITLLNSQYRGKDKITDVLSFPLQENIRAGEFDHIIPELELGDIYICYSVCVDQAKEFKIEYFDEFIHLSVHGFLHLCGYDHELSIQEEKLMESLEKKIIDNISQIKKGSC